MTTNKDLPKPEHGTIQAQDIHEIEKESEADSTEEQNSFHAGFITVQTIGVCPQDPRGFSSPNHLYTCHNLQWNMYNKGRKKSENKKKT